LFFDLKESASRQELARHFSCGQIFRKWTVLMTGFCASSKATGNDYYLEQGTALNTSLFLWLWKVSDVNSLFCGFWFVGNQYSLTP